MSQGGRRSLPTHVGRFEVISELGRGAMGTVLRARDPNLDREVALKLLTSRPEDERRRQRFLREAQLTAELKHPGVVAVHGAGEHQGHPWIAYELLEGDNGDARRVKSPAKARHWIERADANAPRDPEA